MNASLDLCLFQNLRDDVVGKSDIEQEDLHAHKIGRTPRQTAMVVSFATNYPEQFEGSKNSIKARGVDFNAIKTYEEWDAGDGRNGLSNIIINGIRREKTELTAHIHMALAAHLTARTLCDAFLD